MHFWGIKDGDTGQGTPPTTFLTSGADKTSVLGLLGSSVGITSIRDFNRDNNVTAADATVALGSLGSIVRLQIGPGGPFAPAGVGRDAAADATTDVGMASALAANSTTTSAIAPWQLVAVPLLRDAQDAATIAACFAQWPDAASPMARKPLVVDAASVNGSFVDVELLDELAAGLQLP